jgi:glycine/D-amino acid oxidase-like deaminating enzyme
VKERGVDHSLVAPSDVPWLKPEQRGAISRVVRVPDGRIDPKRLLSAYESALASLDVTLIDGFATAVDIGGKSGLFSRGRDKTIKVDHTNEVTAKHVVLANGTYAQALIDRIPDLKQEIPRLVWGAGSALDVSLPDWVKKYGGIDKSVLDIDQVVRTVDRGGACGVHLVPHGDGEYYLGASSGVWFDPEPKARVHALHTLLRSLVEEIHKAFFFAGAAIRGPGFRPVTVDTFPLLGETHIAGVWLANGTKRDGLTCSPYIARELASAILGSECKLPARFKPARKLISYKNKSQAIEDAADGDIGGENQHGLYLPPYAHAPYREAKLAKVRRVYEMRGIDDFGIHPEVTHLYENDEFFAAIDHPREAATN